jgi:hypothetical protein
MAVSEPDNTRVTARDLCTNAHNLHAPHGGKQNKALTFGAFLFVSGNVFDQCVVKPISCPCHTWIPRADSQGIPTLQRVCTYIRNSTHTMR